MKTSRVSSCLLIIVASLLAPPARAQDPSTKALADYRRQIDAIDQRIVSALNERAKIVKEIGHPKQKLQLPVSAPQREREVLDHVTRTNSGPLSSQALRRIYQGIIAEMTAFEQAQMHK